MTLGSFTGHNLLEILMLIILRDVGRITLSAFAAFAGASLCGASLAGAELVGMVGIIVGMVWASMR